MTTVPPPSTPPPPTTAAPPTAPVVQILQPPPAVVALPPGTVLEAVVKPTPPSPDTPATPGKQTVTLRTPQGDVTIKLPVQLPDNARVALEIVRTAVQSPTTQTTPQAPQATTPQTAVPQVTVRVVTIDNQPAVQVLAQLARQQNVDMRAAAAQTPQTQTQPAEAQNPLLRAVVIPPGAAWTPSGMAQLISLGTISGFVMTGNTAMLPAEALLTTLENAANSGQGGASNNLGGNLGGGANASTAAQNVLTAPVAGTAPGTATTPPPFNLTAGSDVGLRIIGITLPGGTPMTVPATPLITAPVIAQTPPGQILAGIIAPGANTTPATTPTPGLIIAGAQGLGPAVPPPPMTVQTPPVLTTLTGTAIAQGTNGAPIIDTGAGQLQLNLRANLPVGTHVTLEITAQMEPRPGALPPPAPLTALPLSGPPGASAGWPTLTESLAVLQRSDPQAAQVLGQAIPDGGPRTAAALIAFAQSMKSGDARQWPGDSALRALERAGPRGAHLASTLSDEVAALSSRTRDSGTEWRALPVPWGAEGHIDRIALITRREGDADDDSKKRSGGGGTRFLINLDLSRLGSMQLDGMFRKESKGFDLMVRTKAALPDQIRNDLMGIFANSNAAMGLKGGLTFQVVKKFPDPVNNGPMSADKSGLWA